MDLSRFHVVTMISNPMRYESRYRLYQDFKTHMQDCKINFWTCELAFGQRPFEIIEPGQDMALGLRTSSVLWHKENCLNRIVQELPDDWEHVAWIDADIIFEHWRGKKAWYVETLHALQHHDIVQLFQDAIDYGPNGEIIQVHKGFAWSYVTGQPVKKPGSYGNHWHPGFAWAMRRSAWNSTGGLIPWAILGAGDNHMAHAWVGRVEEGVNPGIKFPYMNKLLAYQEQCERYIRRNIGYVPGTIRHFWHGKKRDRKYWDRWRILTETQFDPDWDLKYDWQGLYQLADHGDLRSIILRDRIRDYFKSRNEDSIDLE